MGIGKLKSVSRERNSPFHRRLLILAEGPEHMIVQGTTIRSADAHSQPRHVLRRKMDKHRLQPVVSAGAPRLPHPECSERKGNVVQNHEHLVTLKLEIPGVTADRLTAEVHVGLRLHQYAASADGHLGVPLRIETEHGCGPPRQLLGHKKADVVPGSVMLATGISQSGQQTKNRGIFHARKGLLFLLGGCRSRVGFLFLENLRTGHRCRHRLLDHSRLGDGKHRQIGITHGRDFLR